jgi:hypothetical protein
MTFAKNEYFRWLVEKNKQTVFLFDVRSKYYCYPCISIRNIIILCIRIYFYGCEMLMEVTYSHRFNVESLPTLISLLIDFLLPSLHVYSKKSEHCTLQNYDDIIFLRFRFLILSCVEKINQNRYITTSKRISRVYL